MTVINGSSAGTPYDNTLFWRTLRDTGDWERQAIVLDVPLDATWIRIGLLFRGPGTCWFDDLQFSVVDRTVPTTGILLPWMSEPPPGLPRCPRKLDFELHQLTAVAPSVFTRRDVMIPMRDGVRLFTAIAAPRTAPEPLPILLERTPYGTRPQLADEADAMNPEAVKKATAQADVRKRLAALYDRSAFGKGGSVADAQVNIGELHLRALEVWGGPDATDPKRRAVTRATCLYPPTAPRALGPGPRDGGRFHHRRQTDRVPSPAEGGPIAAERGCPRARVGVSGRARPSLSCSAAWAPSPGSSPS